MVEHILGNYLVKMGKISKDELTRVLEKQDLVRVKLGLIAVAEGMLTLEQVSEINKLQAVFDMRFGDIAVSKGYLKDEQVTKLLNKQGDSYMTFVQSIVDLGFATLKDMDKVIEEFQKEEGYGNSEIEALKNNDVEKIVALYVPEDGQDFIDIISVAVRTIIRLIDRRVYIGKVQIIDSFPEEQMVSQALLGQDGLVSCFSEGCGALLKTASVFGEEEFDKIDEDSLDAAGELLNCINGLYVSALSRENKFLELAPPEYNKVSVEIKGDICRLPIYIGDVCMYYTVGKLA